MTSYFGNESRLLNQLTVCCSCHIIEEDVEITHHVEGEVIPTAHQRDAMENIEMSIKRC